MHILNEQLKTIINELPNCSPLIPVSLVSSLSVGLSLFLKRSEHVCIHLIIANAILKKGKFKEMRLN